MLKALIIDDESRARNVLRILLEKHVPSISEIRSSESGEETLTILKDYHPHLIFLDIEMPFMDGFDLLAQIGERSFDVIFTTAYDQYAIKAIKFSALDYLLKPISPQELQEAVNRFLDKKQFKKENGKLYKNFLTNLDQIQNGVPKLAISSQEGTSFLEIDHIIYCEAQSNYTIFYLQNYKRIIASKTLKEYELILRDYEFFRVHKSYLVNLQKIQQFSPSGQLKLQNNFTVEVSRRKKPLLKEKLNL